MPNLNTLSRRLGGVIAVCVVLSACGFDVPYTKPYGNKTYSTPGTHALYTVQSGDTLYGLSRRFGVSQDKIIKDNTLSTHFLKIGQKLRISKSASQPRIVVHRVKKGEYLAKIARRYGVSIQSITSFNTLKSDTIHVGQVLKILLGGGHVATRTSRAASNSRRPISSTGVFITPVRGKRLVNFGAVRTDSVSEGINISAPLGTPVRSADGGQVVYVGNAISGYGNMILVSHAKGFTTVYAHLHKVAVSQGDVVSKTHILGSVGKSGKVTSPQLHFQIRFKQKSVNPDRYLR